MLTGRPEEQQAAQEGISLRNTRLSVIVWNEHIQEHDNPAIRANYPEGLHAVIAQALRRTPGIGAKALPVDVSTATLDQPEHGLDEARLQACDVLIWWATSRTTTFPTRSSSAFIGACSKAWD